MGQTIIFNKKILNKERRLLVVSQTVSSDFEYLF